MTPDFTVTTIDAPSSQSSLDRIEPGARATSYLFHKISGSQGTVGGSGTQMPPSAALGGDEIERIGLYIDGL
jgi:hypothetical protein